jgi:hypothetical protein
MSKDNYAVDQFFVTYARKLWLPLYKCLSGGFRQRRDMQARLSGRDVLDALDRQGRFELLT